MLKKVIKVPSDTFLRLPLEKQEKLLGAAKEEFTKYSYDSVSLNQIIKKAGISRGSFYMYFKGKEELYFYLIDRYLSQGFLLLEETLREQKGNFFPACNAFFAKALVFCSLEENRAFMKRIIENTNFYEESTQRKRKVVLQSFERLEKLIQKKDFTPLAQKHFKILCMQVFHLMMRNSFRILHQKEKVDVVLQDFSEQLLLLKDGVCRKDDVDVKTA